MVQIYNPSRGTQENTKTSKIAIMDSSMLMQKVIFFLDTTDVFIITIKS